MHAGLMRSLLISAAGLALFLPAIPARADLYSANAAFQKNDFPTAFQQFKELAELGQPLAQLHLASMYARGEGVAPSRTFAHAWASLAGQNGESRGTEIAAALEPQLTPNSLLVSADIQAEFGQARLNQRLLPHVLQGREYEDRDPVRPSKPFMTGYPNDAQRKGVQGEVFVEFIVAPDGRARVPRILYAVPTGYFESTVRDSVLRSVYLPGRTNGQPVSTPFSMLYRFKMNELSMNSYGELETRVNEAKAKAEAGDPSAQMLYGMMIAGLPQLNKTYSQAIPWFLKAAQAGAPYAQYQIGTGLLRGRGCQCDNNKGEIWLQKAAQADQADAQVSLAEYLLRDKPSAESLAGAMVWLERAVKQGNDSAKLLLSAILAANPSADIRDPPRALALSDSLPHEYRRDPSLLEIRAAAYASRGDYPAASKAQSQAIEEATRLGWNLQPLQQRAATYASRQSWHGDLLNF